MEQKAEYTAGQKRITPAEALALVDGLLAQIPLTRADQVKVLEAMAVLRECLPT